MRRSAEQSHALVTPGVRQRVPRAERLGELTGWVTDDVAPGTGTDADRNDPGVATRWSLVDGEPPILSPEDVRVLRFEALKFSE